MSGPFLHYSYPYDKETPGPWVHAPVDISGNVTGAIKVIAKPTTKRCQV